MTVGVAIIGVVTAAPASANHAGLTGYYTSGNGISGYYVDPGKALPNGREFSHGPFNENGSAGSQVLSWFGVNYGPNGSDPHSGVTYPQGDRPNIGGLPDNGDVTDIAIAIGTGMVVSEGRSPIRSPGNVDFYNALLGFARGNPGPWSLSVDSVDPGPYTAGTTYNGNLQIRNALGGPVNVSGINVDLGNLNNVASIILGAGAGARTLPGGNLPFTFVAGPNAAEFSAEIYSSNIANRALIFQDLADPGSYQKIIKPEAGRSDTRLQGTAAIATGAIAVTKVDEGVTVGLAGAVFGIYLVTQDGTLAQVDQITTSDGSNGVGLGGALSNQPLAPGTYVINELTAPPGYSLPTAGTTSPAPCTAVGVANCDPLAESQVVTVVGGLYTGVYFADRPKPGRLTIGKYDANLATVTTLPGASFEARKCATSDVSQCGTAGPVQTVGPTPADGILVITGLAAGYYLVTEVTAPTGYSLNDDPQFVQVIPDGNTNVGFIDARQPVVSTQISAQTSESGAILTDAITVSGTGGAGYSSTADYTLLGPVAPLVDANGQPSCAAVSWAGAPVAQTGSVEITGDGTFTTGGFTVVVPGCYTYTEFLNAYVVNLVELVTSAGPSTPGLVTETTLVEEWRSQPEVSTQISDQTAFVGDSITDQIRVTNSDGYQGLVNWTLYGPVAPLADAQGVPNCVGVNWIGAATAATGVVTADGDDTYTTAAYVVAVHGCYTYTELLVGDMNTLPAGPSVPGAVTETTLALPHFPDVSTQISQQTANVGDNIHDAITVTGSGNYDGTSSGPCLARWRPAWIPKESQPASRWIGPAPQSRPKVRSRSTVMAPTSPPTTP